MNATLPPVPPPPSFGPDPRQEIFYQTVGRLGAELQEKGEIRVASTATGYPASAVDLGRLQTEIEQALAGLTLDEIRSRWDAEVLPWLAEFTRNWIQRRKTLRTEIRGHGIALTIETQDDIGHYTYAFDVFPGRRHSDLGR